MNRKCNQNGYYKKFDEKWADKLGKMSDKELSLRSCIDIKTITKIRQKRKIPVYTTNREIWYKEK